MKISLEILRGGGKKLAYAEKGTIDPVRFLRGGAERLAHEEKRAIAPKGFCV